MTRTLLKRPPSDALPPQLCPTLLHGMVVVTGPLRLISSGPVVQCLLRQAALCCPLVRGSPLLPATATGFPWGQVLRHSVAGRWSSRLRITEVAGVEGAPFACHWTCLPLLFNRS